MQSPYCRVVIIKVSICLVIIVRFIIHYLIITLSLFFFFDDALFLGVFLRLDLKLPFLGNLTIHDGGTIILLCTPETTQNLLI